MALRTQYLPGGSPMEFDELSQLIPKDVETQAQLDVLERQNVFNAQRWLEQTRRDLFDEAFAKRLHLKMFGEVWRWGGVYRKTPRVLGVPPERIPAEMQTLLRDVKSWIDNQTYTWPQILGLFHYYLVFIQPFPNGNARFARLYTETLAKAYQQKIPTWGEVKFGGGDLHENCEARTQYIGALRKADDKKIRFLIEFLYS